MISYTVAICGLSILRSAVEYRILLSPLSFAQRICSMSTCVIVIVQRLLKMAQRTWKMRYVLLLR